MAATTATTESLLAERRQLAAGSGYLAGPLLIFGAIVLVATAAIWGWTLDESPRFWHAYMLNVAYVASLSVGGLFFVIALHLFGARWGATVRRLVEAVAGTMPAVFLLFVPIAGVLAAGNTDLYPWSDPGFLAREAVVQAKTLYLNTEFFLIRTAIYLGIWLGLVALFNGTSLRQDETGDVQQLRRLQRYSGPGMLLFALTLNFAAFDWLMSLDPVWFSTIFGVYYWAGGVVGLLATVIITAYVLQARGVMTQSITTEHYHDLSKLMFALTVFWGYSAFSQFLLIWYANIPEETGWYALRQPGGPTYFGMSTMTGALFVVHLFVPFLGFMSRKLRRNKHVMVAWAGYMLAVHWFDLFYVVMPTLQLYNFRDGVDHAAFPIGLPELLCAVGCVAIFLGWLIRNLNGIFLMPIRDPRVNEALSYHNA
ncbi:MAG: hypothetical protein AAGG46_00485 [Planctomycetota bacterium]